MDIKTKPFALDRKLYIKLCTKRLLKKYKWIAVAVFGLTFILSLFLRNYWLNVVSLSAILFFFTVWLLIFYFITKTPQTKMLFDRYFYTISNENILAMVDPRRGMCIPWDKIKSCEERKDGFVLALTQSHIIFFPHKIFKNDFDVSFFRVLLKNKKYLKM
jgi:hypothetical protein